MNNTPQELRDDQNITYIRIYENIQNGSKRGRDVYVAKVYLPNFEAAKSFQHQNYRLASIMRAVCHLNAYHEGGNQQQAISNILHSLTNEGFAFKYKFHANGSVLITNFRISDQFTNHPKASGFYIAGKREDDKYWDNVNKTPVNSLLQTKKWPSNKNNKPDAHYVGLSGKSANPEEASDIVGALIVDAFGNRAEDFNVKTLSSGSQITVGYTQDKEFKNSKSVQRLVSGIEQAAMRKAPLNILTHGEAAQTLYEATKNLTSRAFVRQTEARINEEANIRTIIVNPVGVPAKDLKEACEKAGIEVVATYENNRHVGNLTFKDVFDDHAGKILAASLFAPATPFVADMVSSSKLSGTFTIIKNYTTDATPAGMLTAALGAAMVGRIGYNAIKEVSEDWRNAIQAYYLVSRKGGNNFISEDDEHLIEMMSR
ncbi:hypothetical protein [Marinibactrum halimedae]|uniref:Uncharacterized protein n=1 Tax=Marinibactrum halimedae TaxID=1444977 RepID=A0AA37T9K9_9GAMM|nr:hypothetical protein [Marinibactrum halimedae]MCD9460722.1 hypothetical protein [Marinibactrum halimedae]GLS25152.1 hypothetical protein GCM10007877_08660 [Marinibactrum halimedae]